MRRAASFRAGAVYAVFIRKPEGEFVLRQRLGGFALLREKLGPDAMRAEHALLVADAQGALQSLVEKFRRLFERGRRALAVLDESLRKIALHIAVGVVGRVMQIHRQRFSKLDDGRRIVPGEVVVLAKLAQRAHAADGIRGAAHRFLVHLDGAHEVTVVTRHGCPPTPGPTRTP